jgi:hypothetical protein
VNAETFNSRYPVGTPVFAYPGFRPEDIPSARRLVTRTRTKAQSVGLDREGVVWVDGHGAYISLTHVDPVSMDEWEAAKATEVAAAEQAPKDTLAPWLAQRFDPQGAPWDGMSDDDRSYWEHQARAVRRAVARDGFKAEEAVAA